MNPSKVTQATDFPAVVLGQMREAEYKAWESLSGYKFVMFGYWAGVWVHLNRIGGWAFPNPWVSLVRIARAQIAQDFAENPIDRAMPLAEK